MSVGDKAVEGARDSARGLNMACSGDDTWCDVGAVEWGLGSSSVSEKGELGKTFERRVAQRSGSKVLNLRNAIKYGRKPNDNHGTYSHSTMSWANICAQSLSSVLDFEFPVGFSAVGLNLGPPRALTSCHVDSLSM